MEMGNRLQSSLDSGNCNVQGKAVVRRFADAAGLRQSGSRGFGRGAYVEQNDECRDARKCAYCLNGSLIWENAPQI